MLVGPLRARPTRNLATNVLVAALRAHRSPTREATLRCGWDPHPGSGGLVEGQKDHQHRRREGPDRDALGLRLPSLFISWLFLLCGATGCLALVCLPWLASLPPWSDAPASRLLRSIPLWVRLSALALALVSLAKERVLAEDARWSWNLAFGLTLGPVAVLCCLWLLSPAARTKQGTVPPEPRTCSSSAFVRHRSFLPRW